MTKWRGLFFFVTISLSVHVHSQWFLVNDLNIESADFLNDSTGLLIVNAGDSSYVFKTTDYGSSWDTVFSHYANILFKDVCYATADTCFLCGSSNLFRKSTDRGDTWFSPSDNPPNLRELDFRNGSLGYGASGDGGPTLASTNDGGQTWTVNLEYGARDLFFVDDCNGAGIIGTRYFNTSDCGQNWQDDTLSTNNRSFDCLWKFDNDHIVLAATGGFGTYYGFNFGSVLLSDDNGETYTLIDIPYMQVPRNLFFESDDLGYLVGNPYQGFEYSVLKTTDGGTTWGYQNIGIFPPTNYYPDIYDVLCTSPGNCYALGQGLHRTTNGGGEVNEAWIVLSQPEITLSANSVLFYPNPSSDFVSVQGIPPSMTYIIRISDMAGRIIKSESNKSKIDIHELTTGMYLISIEFDQGRIVKRLLKE